MSRSDEPLNHPNSAAKTESRSNRPDSGELTAGKPTNPDQWRVGDVVEDTYRVDKVFDSGGMGMVYQVQHLGWDTVMAMKVPRQELIHESIFVENFSRECQSWIDLGFHRNVVGCFYLRTVASKPAVFVEYIDGGSLADWIADRRLYTGTDKEVLERLLSVAIQSAQGLMHAQSVGLVHQDIKPANILMTGNGQPKLADFGLARARGLAAESSPGAADATALVTMGGYTPMYCSPEQAMGNRVSRATDVWSWATCVLEMLHGGIAWRSGPEAGQALAALAENGDNQRALQEVPQQLLELLKDTLQVDADARISDAREIVDRLAVIYTSLFETAAPVGNEKDLEMLSAAHNNRGVSLADLNEVDRAIAEFEQALTIDAAHPEATFNLALINWYQEDATENDVMARIARTQQANAASGRPLMMKARFALRRQDLELAIRCWEDATVCLDTRADAAFRLGEAFMGLEQFDDALRNFEIAAANLPHSEKVKTGLKLARSKSRAADGKIYYSRLNCLSTLSDVGGPAALDDTARSIVYIDTAGRLKRWRESTNATEDIPCPGQLLTLSPGGRYAFGIDQDYFVIDTVTGAICGGFSKHALQDSPTCENSRFELSRDGTLAIALTRMRDIGGWAGGVIGHRPESEIWAAEASILDLSRQAIVASFPMTLDRFRSAVTPQGSEASQVGLSADGRHASFSAGASMFHHEIGSSGSIVFDTNAEIGTMVSADYGPEIFAACGTNVLRLDVDNNRLFPVVDMGKPVDEICVRNDRLLVATRDGRVSVRSRDGQDEVAFVDANAIFPEKKVQHKIRHFAVDSVQDRLIIFADDLCKVMDLPALAADRTIGAQMAIAQVSTTDAVDADAQVFRDILKEIEEDVGDNRLEDALAKVETARRLPGFERHPEVIELTTRLLSTLPKGELKLAWSEPVTQIVSKGSGALAIDASTETVFAIGDTSIDIINMSTQATERVDGDFASVTCATCCGDSLVVGLSSGGVGVWQATQDKISIVHSAHEWQVRAITTDSTGTRTVTGSADGSIAVMPIDRPESPMVLKDEGDYGVNAIALSASDDRLLAGCDDQSIRIWSLESSTLEQRIDDLPSRVRSISAIGDERFLIGYEDGVVETVTLGEHIERQRLVDGECATTSMVVLQTSALVVLGQEDGGVDIRSLNDGSRLHRVVDHPSALSTIVAAKNDFSLFSLDADRNLRRWVLDWEVQV